jgi:hypothetical protein
MFGNAKFLGWLEGGFKVAANARITNLENVENKTTYFQAVSSASGTLTPPTGATILLDQFYAGEDAYVSTISNGQPTGDLPLTSGGAVITITGFDVDGNYTLSGTPSAYPVAIIYKLSILEKYKVNLVEDNVLDDEGMNVLTVEYVTSSATPTPTIITNFNQLNVTAQAVGATFGAPVGTFEDGTKLIIRVADNGVARTLAFNAGAGGYRFSTDMPSPGSTIPGTTLYYGFVYNAADDFWDNVAIKNII